jgi:DNA topoisomerase-3
LDYFFPTCSLLRGARRELTDQVAEKLYQKGFLSYPRTETDQYDKDFDFNALLQKQTYDNTWGQFAQRCVTEYRV